VPVEGNETSHLGIMSDWVDSILNGTELLSPGEEGINGLMISNAMHLSAWTDGWVDLPIDEDLFYNKLQEQIENSTFEKKSSKDTKLDVSGTH